MNLFTPSVSVLDLLHAHRVSLSGFALSVQSVRYPDSFHSVRPQIRFPIRGERVYPEVSHGLRFFTFVQNDDYFYEILHPKNCRFIMTTTIVIEKEDDFSHPLSLSLTLSGICFLVSYSTMQCMYLLHKQPSNLECHLLHQLQIQQLNYHIHLLLTNLQQLLGYLQLCNHLMQYRG